MGEISGRDHLKTCIFWYDISMECNVYMGKETFSSSLPTYKYVMKYSVVILGILYQPIVDNATSWVVQWLVRLPGTLENPGLVFSKGKL